MKQGSWKLAAPYKQVLPDRQLVLDCKNKGTMRLESTRFPMVVFVPRKS
jgi:hypothetical protein